MRTAALRGMGLGRIATALVLLGLTPALAHAGAGGASQSHVPTTPPGSISGRWCMGTKVRPSASNVKTVQRAIRCLINHTRIRERVGALRNNQTLQSVAISHSKEMVLSNYFADDSRAGLTPLGQIQSSRYRASSAVVTAAANIGWATGSGATPMRMLEAWMASPPHRENLLSPGYTEIGVGVVPAAPPMLAEGKRGATYTVELAVKSP